MHTEKTVIDTFCDGKKILNWQSKVLVNVDIKYVISNLLKEKFVLEIDEYKYDITFGLNDKGGISSCASIYPSPPLLSSELINRGFKEGKWYLVTDEDLPEEEVTKILNEIKEQEMIKTATEIEEILKEVEIIRNKK